MRKITAHSTILMAVIAIPLLLLSSCSSKDETIANRLSGGWEGDWGMSYVDRHGIQHDSYYSVVEFYPEDDFATYGHGYQEDYYEEGPYTKLGFYFLWSVNHRNISITYPNHPEYDAYIRDYSLPKDHFEGYIGDTHFSLDKVWKYYKWYDYAGRYAATGVVVLYWVGETAYYYDTEGNYYYANQRSTRTTQGDSIAASFDSIGKPMPEDMRPIRIFNRYMQAAESSK